MRNKYACFHGHFHQLPLDNPWTEGSEPEDTAFPYADHLSRVLHECYGPNAAAPKLDSSGEIDSLCDNYRQMSFDFSPPLLAWLETRHPLAYGRIISADRLSLKDRDGHGNALAHPYTHAILPLASYRDKRLLVRWGLADFEFRFGRRPEGMWLPETAVDDETLEVLIAEGIRFTVLAPWQAVGIRAIGAGDDGWAHTARAALNPSLPFRWNSRLDPGRHIAVFFWHEGLSRSVLEDKTLSNAWALSSKILGRLLPDDSSQLVSLVTPGEHYGHAQPDGHRGLPGALDRLRLEGVVPTNFSQFLDLFPPPQEVEISPNSSWTCAHSLGRWRIDCGCRNFAERGWAQHWRAPTREAFAWLTDRVDEVFETAAAGLLKDPWKARENYITRILDRSPLATDRTLSKESLKHLSPEESSRVLTALEMQRHRLLTTTSTAWSADDISEPESVQMLKHAARTLDLAARLGADLHADFKRKLEAAPTNLKEMETASAVYSKLALPAGTTLKRAAAHYAVLHLLGEPQTPASFPFALKKTDLGVKKGAGRGGRPRAFYGADLKISDLRTFENLQCSVLVHQKDRLDICCWVTGHGSVGPRVFEELESLWSENEDEEFRMDLCRRFGQDFFSLDALFARERRNVVRLLSSDRPGTDRGRFLDQWGWAVRRLRSKGSGADDILELLDKCRSLHFSPDGLPLADSVRDHFRDLAARLADRADPEGLSIFLRWLETVERVGLHVNLWEIQHLVWQWRTRVTRQGGEPLERESVRALAAKLNFSEQPAAAEAAHGGKAA